MVETAFVLFFKAQSQVVLVDICFILIRRRRRRRRRNHIIPATSGWADDLFTIHCPAAIFSFWCVELVLGNGILQLADSGQNNQFHNFQHGFVYSGLQAKMQTSTAQVKDLTAQMDQMRVRQIELEARNGVLEHTCTLASSLIQELNEDPVIPHPAFRTMTGRCGVRES
jgi:hypothetical protein